MTSRVGIATAILLALTLWTHARPGTAAAARFDFAGVVPLTFDEWTGRDAPPLDAELARILAATQYVHRYYGDNAIRPLRMAADGPRIADVEVDIAYYARPQAGAAMHSPLNCLPGNGWQVLQTHTVPLTHDRGAATVRRLIVARGEHRIAMTYWFQNRGAIVGNEYRQRLQLLANGLRGNPTDAALVRVMARDTPEGNAAMTRFARALAERLSAEFR